MNIDFLLRCIDTVGVLVDRQAVHLLLHWKIFKFAKVIWIEFLKYRNGSAVARNVNAFQTGVIFHHVRSLGQRQESYGLMLFQIKNRHQFVSFTCQKSSPVLGVKRHSVIPVASPNAVAPDNLIRLRVYHHKNILILEIDIDLAGNGIVLWHSSFAIEMESLDNLVLLDINNGLCLPPLVRNLELVEGSGIRAAVGLSDEPAKREMQPVDLGHGRPAEEQGTPKRARAANTVIGAMVCLAGEDRHSADGQAAGVLRVQRSATSRATRDGLLASNS